MFVNSRPALRVDDIGIHAICCGPNMWQAQQGAPTVFINGKAAFRTNDPSKHCGGQGQLIEGSSDVIELSEYSEARMAVEHHFPQSVIIIITTING